MSGNRATRMHGAVEIKRLERWRSKTLILTTTKNVKSKRGDIMQYKRLVGVGTESKESKNN